MKTTHTSVKRLAVMVAAVVLFPLTLAFAGLRALRTRVRRLRLRFDRKFRSRVRKARLECQRISDAMWELDWLNRAMMPSRHPGKVSFQLFKNGLQKGFNRRCRFLSDCGVRVEVLPYDEDRRCRRRFVALQGRYGFLLQPFFRLAN